MQPYYKVAKGQFPYYGTIELTGANSLVFSVALLSDRVACAFYPAVISNEWSQVIIDDESYDIVERVDIDVALLSTLQLLLLDRPVPNAQIIYVASQKPNRNANSVMLSSIDGYHVYANYTISPIKSGLGLYDAKLENRGYSGPCHFRRGDIVISEIDGRYEFVGFGLLLASEPCIVNRNAVTYVVSLREAVHEIKSVLKRVKESPEQSNIDVPELLSKRTIMHALDIHRSAVNDASKRYSAVENIGYSNLRSINNACSLLYWYETRAQCYIGTNCHLCICLVIRSI